MEQINHDWILQMFPGILLLLSVYAIGFVILFLIVRMAVKSGIKASIAEQSRQNRVITNLLAEQLKTQGVPSQKVEEILDAR